MLEVQTSLSPIRTVAYATLSPASVLSCPSRALIEAPLRAALNICPLILPFFARIWRYWLSTKGLAPVDQESAGSSWRRWRPSTSNARVMESPADPIELGSATAVRPCSIEVWRSPVDAAAQPEANRAATSRATTASAGASSGARLTVDCSPVAASKPARLLGAGPIAVSPGARRQIRLPLDARTDVVDRADVLRGELAVKIRIAVPTTMGKALADRGQGGVVGDLAVPHHLALSGSGLGVQHAVADILAGERRSQRVPHVLGLRVGVKELPDAIDVCNAGDVHVRRVVLGEKVVQRLLELRLEGRHRGHSRDGRSANVVVAHEDRGIAHLIGREGLHLSVELLHLGPEAGDVVVLPLDLGVLRQNSLILAVDGGYRSRGPGVLGIFLQGAVGVDVKSVGDRIAGCSDGGRLGDKDMTMDRGPALCPHCERRRSGEEGRQSSQCKKGGQFSVLHDVNPRSDGLGSPARLTGREPRTRIHEVWPRMPIRPSQASSLLATPRVRLSPIRRGGRCETGRAARHGADDWSGGGRSVSPRSTPQVFAL